MLRRVLSGADSNLSMWWAETVHEESPVSP
jgi:hypothetical protein